jgi:hypothetical protein
MTYVPCAICGEPTDALDATCLVWHARCYTPEAFDAKVLPKVNAYIDGLRIQLAPVMRDALITELVRRQIDSKGYAVFHDLEGIRHQVATQFSELTKVEG